MKNTAVKNSFMNETSFLGISTCYDILTYVSFSSFLLVSFSCTTPILSCAVDIQQYDGVVAILTAVIHITDLKFVHDAETDGVYIENEDLLQISTFPNSY